MASFVRYVMRAKQPVTAVPVRLDFSDKEHDPRNTVATGANWKFTAPEGGVYLVTAAVAIQGIGAVVLPGNTTANLYIHGPAGMYAVASKAAIPPGGFPVVTITTQIALKPGESIHATLDHNGGNAETSGDPPHNYITITGVGPAN